MTRRDAVSAIACAISAAGAPEFFDSWLKAAAGHVAGVGGASVASPEPDRWSNYQPKFFSREEMQILDAFTAILIPTDETPGAREAHIVPFIDFVVNAAGELEPELQEVWRSALQFLRQQKFGAQREAEQLALVERMSQGGGEGHSTYELIKDMAVHAFYTSRVGLIEVLEYQGNAYLIAFPGCNHPEHRHI